VFSSTPGIEPEPLTIPAARQEPAFAGRERESVDAGLVPHQSPETKPSASPFVCKRLGHLAQLGVWKPIGKHIGRDVPPRSVVFPGRKHG
jgi:hypothetical protein